MFWALVCVLLSAAAGVTVYFLVDLFYALIVFGSVFVLSGVLILLLVPPRAKDPLQFSTIDTLLLEGGFVDSFQAADAVMSGVMWFDREMPSKPQLYQLWESAFLHDPLFIKLRSIPRKRGSHYFWEPLSIDSLTIGDHVTVHSVRSTGDSDDAVIAKLQTLLVLPMERNRPLWEIHLLQNDGGRSCILLRVHHCIADGISANALLFRLLTNHLGEPMKLPDFVQNKPTVSKKKKETQFSIWSMLRATIKVLTLKDSRADTETVLKAPTQELRFSGSTRLVLVKELDLLSLKDVKNATNTTVNDVVVSLVAGALRRYMELENDACLASEKNKLSVRGMIPVGFPRDLTTSCLENKWTLVSIKLPVQVPLDDPLERLQQSKKACDFMKRSAEPYIQQSVVDFASKILPLSFQKQINSEVMKRHHLVFTNIPGPQEQLFLCGYEVSSILPVFVNVVTQLSFLSYNGKMSVSWNVDPNVVKNPDILGPLIQQELSALVLAIRTRRRTSMEESERTPLLAQSNGYGAV